MHSGDKREPVGLMMIECAEMRTYTAVAADDAVSAKCDLCACTCLRSTLSGYVWSRSP